MVIRKTIYEQQLQSVLAHLQVLPATLPASNLHSPASAGSAAAAGSLFRREEEDGQLSADESSANHTDGSFVAAMPALYFDWSQFMIEDGSPPPAGNNLELDAMFKSADIQAILEQCGMIPSVAGSIRL